MRVKITFTSNPSQKMLKTFLDWVKIIDPEPSYYPDGLSFCGQNISLDGLRSKKDFPFIESAEELTTDHCLWKPD